MANRLQNEMPKARIYLTSPLKLLRAGDFSHGQASAPLSERKKVNLTKNNLNAALADASPTIKLTVNNTLTADNRTMAALKGAQGS
jgi:type VI secretion system protein ImpB